MISFLSSVAYSAAELADKWLPLPTKLSQTLELKRHWKDEIAPDSINSKSPSLWIHGASVGELEDLSLSLIHI